MSRRILADTNVALRYAQATAPEFPAIRVAVERLVAAGDTIFITPQVLREFWVVATRPETSNGMGLTTAEAARGVTLLLREFTFLDDDPGIFSDWLDLVARHDVKGVQAHDANHAVGARFHGLTHVLTLNPGDFRRYALAGLAVLTPEDA